MHLARVSRLSLWAPTFTQFSTIRVTCRLPTCYLKYTTPLTSESPVFARLKGYDKVSSGLDRKVFAAVVIVIFLFSTPALLTPVTGHFTVGVNSPVPRFRANDYDRHVSGPIGYVWPGGAFSFLTGGVSPGTAWAGTPASIPGYQTPYPGHNPPNAPLSWYQLEGTAYAPFGSILTSTDDQANVGDLVFALNFTCNGVGLLPESICFNGFDFVGSPPQGDESNPPIKPEVLLGPGGPARLNFTAVYIYLPPEFDLSRLVDNPGLVSTSWTNNLEDYSVYKVNQWDAWAPGWWLLRIGAPIHWWGPEHNFAEWWYVRLNQVIAPKIAGRYFFKIFLESGRDFSMHWPGGFANGCTFGAPALCLTTINDDGFASLGGGGRTPMGASAVTVPVQNWPVLLVKGEIDPAIVTGTLRYGTFNTTIYGRAIDLPGRVRLVGNAIDPYDPKRPVLARKVEARGYFNASARGHFEVEGVAPGVYDILASAAGYPEQLIASKVTLLPGQSFHVDGYLQPGAVVHGQVFSKHNFGEEPWPATAFKCRIQVQFDTNVPEIHIAPCKPPFNVASVTFPATASELAGCIAFGCTVLSVLDVWADGARPVYIELYNKNDYKDSSVVAYSPLNLTHSPWMAYDWRRLAAGPSPRRVAFDWESNAAGPGGAISYYQNTGAPPYANAPGFPTQCGSVTTAGATSSLGAGSIVDPCGVHNGVGPAQFWWVDSAGLFTNGGGPNSFIWRFGVKGVYGAPTEIDGHVPQPLAAWVNGLTPGRYWVRVWVNGYVQTKADGVTLDEYFFDVAANEWAGDIFTPVDLRKSSKIVKTVHFHNLPGELIDQPICVRGTDAHSSCNFPFLDKGNRYLIAEARDLDGNLRGFNFTFVGQSASSATIIINGFGMEGGMPTPGSGPGNIAPCTNVELNPGPNQPPYRINPNADCESPWVVGFGFGFKYSLFAMQGIRDYGLLAGTYKVYVYMRGYVQQEFESVTLTLSGSDAFISNHMYRGARFNITLFSIDFERPRVQRPWEFPGARLRVYFFDSAGRNVNYVGVGRGPAFGRPADPRRQPLACFPASSFGFSSKQCSSNDATSDPTGTTIQIVHWDGWFIADSFGHETQDLFASLDGLFIPLFLSGFFFPCATASCEGTFNLIPVQWLANDGDGFLYNPSYYRLDKSANYRTRLALETDTYSVYGYTYGYVQKKDFTFYTTKGQIGDIKLNLMQGVNITLDIKFKRENVFVNTPFNMSMRVRVFNEQGLLVGALSTSNPNTYTNTPYTFDLNTGAPTYTGRMFGWTGSRENALFTEGNIDLWLLGTLVTDLEYRPTGNGGGFYVDPGCGGTIGYLSTGAPLASNMCTSVLQGLNSANGPGLVDPAVASDGFLFHWPGGGYLGLTLANSGGWSLPGGTLGPAGYYAFDSNTVSPNVVNYYKMGFGARVANAPCALGLGIPFCLFNAATPTTWVAAGVDQLRVNMAGIMDRYDPLGPLGSGKLKFAIPKISAFMYGIDGYPNYQGEWTIEVDFTPLYPSPRFDCTGAGSLGAGLPCANNWWPVEGLLTGDSFHVIPGAGFGKTGDSLAGNHLGPFTQRAIWRVPNAHLAAEASVIFEVDKLGFISGQVFGFTWSDELRTQSWTVLQAVSADGKQTFNIYSFDSLYSMYLPAGTWKFTVYTWSPSKNQGFKTITNTVVISNGQITFGVNYYLERSNIPIPEFTTTALLAFAALLSSMYIVRKHAKRKQ